MNKVHGNFPTKKEDFENKRRKCGLPHVFLFPHCFLSSIDEFHHMINICHDVKCFQDRISFTVYEYRFFC